MRNCPTLHLDTNLSKGTSRSKKGYGCKWARETIQHYTYTHIKVKEQLIAIKDMDVNEHETLSNITLRHRLR